MRISEMTNIWDSVSDLSGRDRGEVYVHRARMVIHRIEFDPEVRADAVVGGRVDRAFLCNRIECCASVLRQNVRIRKLILDLESRLKRNRPIGTACLMAR